MLTRAILFTLFTVCWAAHAAAQTTIFVVRHAERADAVSGGTMMMAADPELSESGRTRAEGLALALKDARITAIYTTEYKRTQQTAAPLAEALDLEVTTVSSKEMGGLIERLKNEKGNVLVVGHSNTVPEILQRLGVTAPVKVDDSDYDDLFIVTTGPEPQLLRLHYR